MQKVDFIKMHGLGNDFVIIDKRSNNIAITEDIIKRLSDRRTGAGCDQLITINNTSNQSADAEIEIFNPGGDRAEACGNGTRCVAKILFDEDSNKEILKILDAAKKRNLLAGLHNGTPEYAQKMIDKGFNLVTVGSDSRYITAGAKSDLEKLKGIKGSKSKGY